jgi:small subunit ribosomal protein S20
MANHPSAEKRNRQRVVRTVRNRSIKSSVRTKIRVARAAAETPGTPEAKAKMVEAVSSLDRAASKGVIHAKTASRKKARLARAAHKAAVAAKA